MSVKITKLEHARSKGCAMDTFLSQAKGAHQNQLNEDGISQQRLIKFVPMAKK